MKCPLFQFMIIAPKNPFHLPSVLLQCLPGSVCYHSGFISTLWLQCIEMRLFDELSRCAPWTTHTNIYSWQQEMTGRFWGDRKEAEKELFVMLFIVYTGETWYFWECVCMCECHLQRQHWICSEIIHDLDEGQRVRNIGKVNKMRTLGKNENKGDNSRSRR